MREIKIDSTWKKMLSNEFDKPYWRELTDYVRAQYQQGMVFPPANQIFRAFDLCPFDSVKVVILGQDPYHGVKQANGLCFAVTDGVAVPPSLQNIYKEILQDTGVIPLPGGDLTRWATQGVLLLNSVLTVAAHQPASHAKKGWEVFTDAAITALNEQREGIVYMLWGKYAQTKGELINREKNLVLTSGHPSPYSAHLFHGNHHFSRCNTYLFSQGKDPIDWQ